MLHVLQGPQQLLWKRLLVVFMCRICNLPGSMYLKSSPRLLSPWGTDALSWRRGLALPPGLPGQS